MANSEHLAVLTQGVEVWNRWRGAHQDLTPALSEADLRGADLRGADLRGVDLAGADLRGANLRANLAGANLREANLFGADLAGANLSRTNLLWANLAGANLREANLSRTNLLWANLAGADLSRADCSEARLVSAMLVETNFERANLTGCQVYGISAWGLNLVDAQQSDLVITRDDEPVITVDNVEVAQFIYLLLHNEKIRQVIETVTSKAVLILGRFTPERKAVLDAMREELRRHNYVPILFDFAGPENRDFTETITTLARMARFIIADLTEPMSIPKELEAIVPTLAVPVQPLLEGSTRPYSMLDDYWKYPWVLKVYRYKSCEQLIASLGDRVIARAEAKVQQLAKRRRAHAEARLQQHPPTGDQKGTPHGHN
jgi:hypothetical protein